MISLGDAPHAYGEEAIRPRNSARHSPLAKSRRRTSALLKHVRKGSTLLEGSSPDASLPQLPPESLGRSAILDYFARSVYFNDSRCRIARSSASSSEPRMTSIFSSIVARCPGESDVCGSTC